MPPHKKEYPKRKEYKYLIAVFVLTIAHFFMMMQFFAPAVSMPDANGYFSQAKLIAKNGNACYTPESVLEYIPSSFNEVRPGEFYSVEGPGYPMLLSVFYKVFSPETSLLIAPLLTSVTIVLLFLFCGTYIEEKWALLLCFMLSLNPVINEHAFSGNSLAAVSFLLFSGLYLLLRWAIDGGNGRAVLSGILIGIIPTVRYPDSFFLLAPIIFVFLVLGNRKRKFKESLSFFLPMTVPIILLLIQNQIVYEAYYKTGYTFTSEQMSFGWLSFFKKSSLVITDLVATGAGPLFLAGVFGCVVMISNKQSRNIGMLLLLSLVPITGFYMSYTVSSDVDPTRYLVPTFYIYSLFAVYFIRAVANAEIIPQGVVFAVMVAVTLWWGLSSSIQRLGSTKTQNENLSYIADKVRKTLPDGCIIITYEGISQNLDYLGQWHLSSLSLLEDTGSEGFMSLGDKGMTTKSAFLNKYKDLPQEKLSSAYYDELEKWAGKKYRVFLMVGPERIDSLKSGIFKNVSLKEFGKIEMEKETEKTDESSSGLFKKKSTVIHDYRIGTDLDLYECVLN